MSLFAVSTSPAVAARARQHRAPAPSTRCAASARCAAIPGGSRARALASSAFFGARSGLVSTRASIGASATPPRRARDRRAVSPRAAAAGTKIIVQGIHLTITDSIKAYAESKINKAVSHFDLHDVREVDVRCSARGGEKQLGGDAHKTTVSVYTKNGVVRSEEEADDLYAAIDAVSDKLERKLRKLKEKKKAQRPGHNKNNPRSATAAAVEAAADAAASADEEIEFDEPVVERFQAVRRCTAGDAAAEMETLNHTFFAFKNIAQGGEVNVVYKRSDGGYGVIVPVDMD